MEWTSHEWSHHQRLSWLNVIDQSVKGSGHRCLRHASFWRLLARWEPWIATGDSVSLVTWLWQIWQTLTHYTSGGKSTPNCLHGTARLCHQQMVWILGEMATVCSYNTMHCWFRWSKLNSLINTSNHLAPREKIHRFKGIGLGLHLAPKIPFSMCDMYYVCTEQSWLKRYARLWESTSLDLIESGGATLGVWSI